MPAPAKINFQEEIDGLKHKAHERRSYLMDQMRPLQEEMNQIDSMLTSIDGRARTSRSGTPRRRRATTEGPSRADQFLAVVRDNPGMKVADIGKKMNANLAAGDTPVNNNYLYRVRDSLLTDGKIVEEGDGGYRVTEQAA